MFPLVGDLTKFELIILLVVNFGCILWSTLDDMCVHNGGDVVI